MLLWQPQLQLLMSPSDSTCSSEALQATAIIIALHHSSSPASVTLSAAQVKCRQHQSKCQQFPVNCQQHQSNCQQHQSDCQQHHQQHQSKCQQHKSKCWQLQSKYQQHHLIVSSTITFSAASRQYSSFLCKGLTSWMPKQGTSFPFAFALSGIQVMGSRHPIV